MDQDLAALVFKAATTVVGLLWTDARELAKSGLGDPRRRLRSGHMQAVQADIAKACARLPAACQAGDNHAEQDIVLERSGRPQHTVSSAPQAADALARLTQLDLLPALSGIAQAVGGRLEMRADVSASGVFIRLAAGSASRMGECFG
jgi:hypothetical protein